MTAGPSLAERLDLKRGMRCWFHDMPDHIAAAIDAEAHGVDVQPTASAGLQAAHLFVKDRVTLEQQLAALLPLMQTGGFIWVSWPADGELGEEAVRTTGAFKGLDDVKTCALDDDWPALKLSVGKEVR